MPGSSTARSLDNAPTTTTATATATATTADRRRRAHRKVKTGCRACKARRQKCDEQRPRCSGCVRHSTHCSYAAASEQVRDQNQASRETRSSSFSSSQQLVTTVNEPRHLPSTPRNIPRNVSRASPSRDLDFDDLELLHQYITSTCVATSQLPERTVQMQTSVPRLAQTHHFLMRGILGNAAVHLSWLRPDRKAHYALLAAKHHSVALPAFRSALQQITQDNYSALIMYSKGLVWRSFARFETPSGRESQGTVASHGTNVDAEDTNWLPNWFHLLRGSCLIVEHCAPWIQNGPHALPKLDEESIVSFSNSLDSHHLALLTSQLLPLTDSPTCEPVLSALRESFARASILHHNTPLRNAINFFVGAVPNAFVDAVQKAEPWALAVMAYFSVLVYRSETRWFMRGHGVELLRAVSERLAGQPWEEYIQWPQEEVGF